MCWHEAALMCWHEIEEERRLRRAKLDEYFCLRKQEQRRLAAEYGRSDKEREDDLLKEEYGQ